MKEMYTSCKKLEAAGKNYESILTTDEKVNPESAMDDLLRLTAENLQRRYYNVNTKVVGPSLHIPVSEKVEQFIEGETQKKGRIIYDFKVK